VTQDAQQAIRKNGQKAQILSVIFLSFRPIGREPTVRKNRRFSALLFVPGFCPSGIGTLKNIFRIFCFSGIIIVSGCTSAPKKAPTSGPETSYHLSAGVRLYDDKKYAEAITQFESAMKIEPNNPLVHYELALTYMQLNEYDKCIATTKKGLKNPADQKRNLTTLLATCYSESGDINQAVSLYKSVLRSNSRDPELHYNLAVAYTKQNKVREAIDHFEKSIKNKPDYASPYLALGQLHRLSNNQSMAMIYFMKFSLLEKNSRRTQQAAKQITYILYNGVDTESNNIAVNLNQNDDSLLTLDLALKLIALNAMAEGDRITPKIHADALNKFVGLTKELVENDPELYNSFFWDHALSDIANLHSKNDFIPFAHKLAEMAGFR